MNSVQRVMQRINTIEQRFGVRPQNNSASFADTLTKAEQKLVPAIHNPGKSEITQMIHLAAQKNGVDPKLAMAVAQTESSFEPDAISSAGAVGIMQLMPDTAKSLGVRNIHDPRENIDGGIRYLKQLLNSFNGDLTKTLAAYNAGPGAVKQYNGVPPYDETRQYVDKVLKLYQNG